MTTDMIAYAAHGVFVQAWIGAEDQLPRRLRAVYANDPAQLRHQMDLSNWQLDPVLPPDNFTSSRAEAAKRIPFAHPGATPPPGAQPPPAGQPAKTP